MGKLVVTEFMSLDGIIEDPGGAEGTAQGGWSFRFPAPEGQQSKFEELLASDVQLLGRVTYEGFAAAWPGMEEAAGEFGKMMNDMPKVVVSSTLTDPAWHNTTVISDDVPAAVARLKNQYDGDVLVSGSATLTGAGRLPQGGARRAAAHLPAGREAARSGAGELAAAAGTPVDVARVIRAFADAGATTVVLQPTADDPDVAITMTLAADARALLSSGSVRSQAPSP